MAANSRETKFHGFSASQYLASIFAARLHLIHDSWYMTGHIILNAMPRPMISVKVHREIVPYLNPYSFFLSFFLLPNMLHHCRQTRVSVKLQKLAVNSRCIKSSTAAPSLCTYSHAANTFPHRDPCGSSQKVTGGESSSGFTITNRITSRSWCILQWQDIGDPSRACIRGDARCSFLPMPSFVSCMLAIHVVMCESQLVTRYLGEPGLSPLDFLKVPGYAIQASFGTSVSNRSFVPEAMVHRGTQQLKFGNSRSS